MNDRSFSDELALKNAFFIVLIKSINFEDKPIYTYLATTAKNLKRLTKQDPNQMIDFAKFGEIIACDYGEPSEELKKEIEEEYAFNHNVFFQIIDMSQNN